MAANFSELSYREPQSALSGFILALHDLLDELVKSNQSPLGEPLFWPELLEYMLPAWEIESRRFDPVAKMAYEVSDEKLTEHGLTGPTLRLKLRVVSFLHERYLAVGKSGLRRLIEAINDLLKSYLAAIGANEAIAEIKDFIRNSLMP